MEDNFEAMVDFLETYGWIYNFKLTDFFLDRVWENIPDEWCGCLLSLTDEELNQLPYGNIKDSWPASFKDFVRTAITLSFKRSHKNNVDTVNIDADLKRGMNPKKQHEVMKMAALVNEMALKTGSDVIVDVGSGLGYLGQTLHRKFNHKIIGIEGKQSHTSGADKRTPTLIDGITNVTCELENTSESMENFHSVIKEVLRSSRSQTVGLINAYDKTSNFSGTENRNICINSEVGQKTCFPVIDPKKCDKIPNFSGTEDRTIGTNTKGELFPVEDSSTMNYSNSFSSELGALSSSKTVIDKVGQVHSMANCCDNDKFEIDSTLATCGSDNVLSEGPNVMKNNNGQTYCCQGNLMSNNKSSEMEKNQPCACDKNKPESQQRQDFNSPGACNSDFNEPLSGIPNILMIGLHCCGDLTPTMMSYFTKLEYIRGLCCVSCCYHRMNYNEQKGRFDNFPLSIKLKSVLDVKQNWNLNLFAMRLGAQETRTRWKTQSKEDHDYHMKNVAYRGILQLFCRQDVHDSNKLFRKLARKGDMTSFTSYIDAVICRTKLSDAVNEIDTAEVKEELHKLYNQYENYFRYIEPFTALQVILQPVIETLINLDRQTWLQEQGYSTDIVPVFDDRISPRNLAVVAIKDKF